jgi:hypothetical protein
MYARQSDPDMTLSYLYTCQMYIISGLWRNKHPFSGSHILYPDYLNALTIQTDLWIMLSVCVCVYVVVHFIRLICGLCSFQLLVPRCSSGYVQCFIRSVAISLLAVSIDKTNGRPSSRPHMSHILYPNELRYRHSWLDPIASSKQITLFSTTCPIDRLALTKQTAICRAINNYIHVCRNIMDRHRPGEPVPREHRKIWANISYVINNTSPKRIIDQYDVLKKGELNLSLVIYYWPYNYRAVNYIKLSITNTINCDSFRD